ncbi:MAG: F0F1 ATP synthase subunit B' [Rhodobacteraceae bacterium]|nr:F0F1 ATP synthase subunit B' [Paracoccaceae bacterium]
MASETTTEAGHGAAAAEHYEGMPQLNFDWFPNQIFWLVVTLVVIYLVLVKVALPRIASVLAERHSAMANDLEAAESFKQKAVEAEEAYNAALAEARSEAGRIVAAAKADIQADLDKAIAKADAEIAVKSAESEKTITEIRDGAMKDVEVVAKATTAEIIKAVLPGTGDAKAVTAAVKARIKGMGA